MIASLLAPIACLVLSAAVATAAGSRFGPYQYLSPLPGSQNVSPLNNIILRDGRDIDAGSLSGAVVTVAGTLSGTHTGRLVLSDDGRTLVFLPDRPFRSRERVFVAMERGPRTRSGESLAPVAFDFTVAASAPVSPRRIDPIDDLGADPVAASASDPAEVPDQVQGDLPAGYPPITLVAKNDPAPGYVFCTPAKNTAPVDNFHMVILDNNAMPIFYRRTPSRPVDFKKLPDGRLVYCEIGKRAFYALDSQYAVVDSFKAGNGYSLDSHDIVVLPNNHAWLLIYEQMPVDMSLLVPGGNPNAIVTGLLIQEIDVAKNVVFQWRSWDHMPVTDRSSACGSLTDSLIDYVHGNALERDHDGNILLCSRYLNEVTKIDRSTGELIWRFGRNSKNNQFTIVGDSLGFSDQHDARRLPNGHITLFDNHNCVSPKNARALEYELDEVNQTATLVWEYRHVPDQASLSGGGFHSFAGGGGMVSWGQTTPPHVTEVRPDGTVAFELSFWAAPTRSVSYRSYRFPWRANVFTADHDSLDFGTVVAGDSASLPLMITNHTAGPLTLTSFVTLDSSFSVADTVPLTIPAGGSATVQVKFRPIAGGEVATTLYVRSASATELIAYPVSIRGEGDTSTPARLALFDAKWTSEGVEVRWQLGAPETGAVASAERSAGPHGAWVAVEGDLRDEDGMTVLLDRSATAGSDWYYRLVIAAPDGSQWTSQPLALAGAATAFDFALLGVSPTPSHGATRIEFTAARDARVRLSVLDVQGRRVAVLADGVYRAGRHQAVWDGDRPGASAAGLYFLRYEWPGGASVRRVVRIR